ncbi:hypothetical protein [Arcticibacterium luteifluviistationis]|uniref:Uncharacterized protein n=1 Tax=Arcticibacterium luteifluviistationis TaxID=1784714 RepID=A0A2Z4GAF3_9BACT|nr:hypothetical protein [Arcticibacterium luteifluviistationis]AWV98124.1 hypothetical protein DJ013_08030 [Arcticibacterium luteifluviistationis]
MPLESTTSKISSETLINRSKINSEETINYLKDRNLETFADLEGLNSMCYIEAIHKDYYLHSKSYDLDFDIETTWNGYMNVPPSISWSGSKLSFSFAYDKQPRNISYEGDKYDGLKDDQLIFIVIKLLFGLFKLAVTHYVSKVSPEEKMVKLCYVDGGKSSGSQYIRFEKIDENRTRVIHDTRYKSDSKFRDEKLYPILHEMIISQFHNNVKKYLTSNH